MSTKSSWPRPGAALASPTSSSHVPISDHYQSALLVASFLLVSPTAIAQTGSLQSPTLDRIRQIEASEFDRQKAENAQWHTFPADTEAERKRFGIYVLQRVDRCSYYWPGWKLIPGTSIRTTSMRCTVSLHTEVAVDCSTLKMATRDSLSAKLSRGQWYDWEVPTTNGSKDPYQQYGSQKMIAALCDNVVKSR